MHIAGPAGGRWRVLTVWDSREAFQRFREEKLLPAFREIAGDDAPPPGDPDVNEVHTFIKQGQTRFITQPTIVHQTRFVRSALTATRADRRPRRADQDLE